MLFQDHPQFDSCRCVVFHCDITKDDLIVNVPPSSVDVVSVIFVLSAIHPDKMVQVLRNIHTVRGINERKVKEMFYLTMHSTHFIFGYVASNIW